MMRQLQPVQVGDVELLVETVLVPGSEHTASLDDAGEKVLDAFDRAQAAIVALAGKVAGTVDELTARAARPQRLEVQFGLSFSVEGRIIVAGATAEASLHVTVGYGRDD
jgi:Trypsin-co-occurring domain 1